MKLNPIFKSAPFLLALILTACSFGETPSEPAVIELEPGENKTTDSESPENPENSESTPASGEAKDGRETGETAEVSATEEDKDVQTDSGKSKKSKEDETGFIEFKEGFCAGEGDGKLMLLFYDSSKGELAYINDGVNEAFDEYKAEDEQKDDGTEYKMIEVRGLKLGYYEKDSKTILVDAQGNEYSAEPVTQAPQL